MGSVNNQLENGHAGAELPFCFYQQFVEKVENTGFERKTVVENSLVTFFGRFQPLTTPGHRFSEGCYRR